MPTRSSLGRASRRFRSSCRTSAPAARARSTSRPSGRTLERRAADPPRSHRAPALPGPELHRRHARLPAALRLLLQGRLLRAAAARSIPSAWTTRSRKSIGCRAGISISSTIICSATDDSPAPVRRHARHGSAVPGRGHRRFGSARRPHRARGRSRAAESLRRLRDPDAGQPAAQQQAAESGPRLHGGHRRGCTALAS